MPLLLVFGGGLLLGGTGGFVSGSGVDGISRLVKWGVIGAGGYVIAKQVGVIR